MGLRKKCIVTPGQKIDLSQIDANATFGWTKKEAKNQTAKNLARLADLQELAYAGQQNAFLFVFQGMDTGGKDGIIKTVIGALNPNGAHVAAFKKPTKEELEHDFLWRIKKQMPKKGEIVAFNRSHYEDVGVVRVHGLITEEESKKRLAQINAFESEASAPSTEIPGGTHILKFWLHISPDEQWERLSERFNTAGKEWKCNLGDLTERQYWDKYMEYLSEAISGSSTEQSPWFVIPANHKWMRDLIISQVIVKYMENLEMKYPDPSPEIAEAAKKYFSGKAPDDNIVRAKPPVTSAPKL